jgi:hypothetical protein
MVRVVRTAPPDDGTKKVAVPFNEGVLNAFHDPGEGLGHRLLVTCAVERPRRYCTWLWRRSAARCGPMSLVAATSWIRASATDLR